MGSGPPPPPSSPATKRLPRVSRFTVTFVFPFPFPFCGHGREARTGRNPLKPNPPGLIADVSRFWVLEAGRDWGYLGVTVVVGVKALIPRNVWDLSQTSSGHGRG